MIQIEKNKLYLVTGGGGFLGQPLVKHILNEGARVRIIGRDEGTLVMMKERHPSIEIHPGDISDEFEFILNVLKSSPTEMYISLKIHTFEVSDWCQIQKCK